MNKRIKISITEKEFQAISDLIEAEIESIYQDCGKYEGNRIFLKDSCYYPLIKYWHNVEKKYLKALKDKHTAGDL